MKNVFVKISVCGECGTGKTTISKKILEVLKAEGIDVVRVDDMESDLTSEELSRNLKALSGNCNVFIEATNIKKVFT